MFGLIKTQLLQDSEVRRATSNPHCSALAVIYRLLKVSKFKRSSCASGESNNSGHLSSWKDLPLSRLNMRLGQRGGDVLSACNNLIRSQLSVSSGERLQDCVTPAECADKQGTPSRAPESRKIKYILKWDVEKKGFPWDNPSLTGVDCAHTYLVKQMEVLLLSVQFILLLSRCVLEPCCPPWPISNPCFHSTLCLCHTPQNDLGKAVWHWGFSLFADVDGCEIPVATSSH